MTTMALKLKENEWDRKIHEGDKALDAFLNCLNGVGETGKARISLFISEVRDDGKADSGKL